MDRQNIPPMDVAPEMPGRTPEIRMPMHSEKHDLRNREGMRS